ncbi:MAG: rhamnulokinase [Planctomycetes bacterium]|nr:rhamnulokinase [Planctomycetota bacterium]
MGRTHRVYLAVDLGASSGRVVAGLFDGARLAIEEVHRFENGGVLANDRLYWDILGLWQRIQDGLRAASNRYGDRIASVGVDTWGVDFGLLGEHDELLGNPYHYRDRHTDGVMEKVVARIGRETIFQETGLQFLPFNTLFQWVALREARSPLLRHAKSFLMIPDLFHWLLTGIRSSEYTNATTTQFFNPTTRDWARSLLDRLELPSRMLGEILEPGTRIGKVRSSVAGETGLRGVDVVLPGTHDTASAVMAVPARGTIGDAPDWCYLSSGTWSLMGVELRRPVIDRLCVERNFTNEGGVGGTVRLLKNIAGLWLVQECRRIWKREGRDLDWDALTRAASQSPGGLSLIDPDHPRFLAPADMPAEIRAACRETHQPVPDTDGAVIRCALDSLALRYRDVTRWLEQLTGRPIDVVHVVGGGSRNQLLTQRTADLCGRMVLAGPSEATAVGNLMMQAVAAGDVAGIPEARDVIRASFPLIACEPSPVPAFDELVARFEQVVAQMGR